MALTALPAASLVHNKAQNAVVGGTAADTVNFNSAPNNGRTIVIIQTGATPGTVAVGFGRTVDGVAPADVNVLDQAGGALAANATYVLLLGSTSDYGSSVTLKASQATTKFTVLSIAA